jgi:hypothetical protein
VGLSKRRFLTTVSVGTDSSQLLITSKPEVVKLIIVPALGRNQSAPDVGQEFLLTQPVGVVESENYVVGITGRG